MTTLHQQATSLTLINTIAIDILFLNLAYYVQIVSTCTSRKRRHDGTPVQRLSPTCLGELEQ